MAVIARQYFPASVVDNASWEACAMARNPHPMLTAEIEFLTHLANGNAPARQRKRERDRKERLRLKHKIKRIDKP